MGLINNHSRFSPCMNCIHVRETGSKRCPNCGTLDITQSQQKLINEIIINGNNESTLLAEALDRDLNSINESLRRLEKGGVIERLGTRGQGRAIIWGVVK